MSGCGETRRRIFSTGAALAVMAAGGAYAAPGVEQGGRKDPYATIRFGNDGRTVFARH